MNRGFGIRRHKGTPDEWVVFGFAVGMFWIGRTAIAVNFSTANLDHAEGDLARYYRYWPLVFIRVK